LSLMICAEVFRQIPLYSDFGHYPDNILFGAFRVNYEQDLAEMITKDKFIYTNHTTTLITNPLQLTLIAGWGKSPLVEYTGTGAYFLDKIEEGAWRVEIMPDAIVTDNLFGKNSLEKPRAVLRYERHSIKFHLPGFENGFAIESLDWRDSLIYFETKGNEVGLKPGVYLLMSPGYEKNDSILLKTNRNFAWKGTPSMPEGNVEAPMAYSSARVVPIDKVKSKDPIVLFEAASDHEWLNRKWVPESGLKKNDASGTSYLNLMLKGLTEVDDENPDASLVADYAMRHYFGDLIAGREKEVIKKKTLVVNATTFGSHSFPIQVALVMKDGSAFGGLIQLTPDVTEHKIKLSDLMKVTPIILPRPYPTFLPYFSSAGYATELDLNQIESLQISIGPGIPKDDWAKTYEVGIMSVWLE
jgi:hypothetical protein